MKTFSEDAPFADVALAAMEPLLVLLPRGWTQARVEFDARDDLLTARAFTAPATGEEPFPDMGMDRGVWTRCLGTAFARLRDEVRQHGVQWDGTAATCEKADLERGLVTLLNANDASACSIPLARDVMRGQTITDDTLGIMLDRMGRFAQMQRSVAEKAATMTGWSYDAGAQRVTFEQADGSRNVVPAQVLGSYVTSEGTWVWAWANSSYRREEYARVLPLRDRAYGWTGAGALWRPGFYCDEKFAGALTLLAATEIGASGVFPPRINDSMRVYYALLD